MLDIDHLPKAIRYLASLFASKNQDQFADGKDSCGNTSTFVAERASRSRTKPSHFAAGSFILRCILEKFFLVFSILFIHLVFNPVLATSFQQSTDPIQPISIEVEHYHAKAAQGQYEWVAADQAGFSGDGAMQALPEVGAIYTQDYVTQSPRLDYRVNFNSAGTYYVWLRAFGPSESANSVHIGLDGQKVSTAENIYIPVTDDYAWTYGLGHSIEITAPGEHILNIWMRESGTVIDKLVLSQDAGFTPADKGPDETPKANGDGQSSGDDTSDNTLPFQQSTDPIQPISIEVEHYHAKAAQGQYEWVAADQAGFSGDGAMQALPEVGAIYTQDYVTQSPRLDYRVNFNSAGTYYVWLRAFGPSESANSVHIGLDGQKVSTAENIYIPVTDDYAWTYGLGHSIEITAPGEHILNIWMRESGTVIDKLVLSQDAGFTPADKGPDETPKANGDGQSSGDDSSGGESDNNGDSNNGEADTGESSGKKVILSWDPSPVSVLGYIVYYGATPETASQQAATLSVDLGTIDALDPNWPCDLKEDLGVLPGERVCFRVKAYDGSQLSDYSEAVCTTY
jgi:hypothetical protein